MVDYQTFVNGLLSNEVLLHICQLFAYREICEPAPSTHLIYSLFIRTFKIVRRRLKKQFSLIGFSRLE